jgi:hypothetical protein
MLASGVIEASLSPYSSPIVMAPTKYGRFRFYVDFLRLNEITEDSAQPLPVIHEVLKDLGEATIFSTLDLCSEYWQIPLTDRARNYTVFVTPDSRQYAFRVTPFRLQGAGRAGLEYLGYIITATHNKVKPEHVRAVLEAESHGPGRTLSLYCCLRVAKGIRS